MRGNNRQCGILRGYLYVEGVQVVVVGHCVGCCEPEFVHGRLTRACSGGYPEILTRRQHLMEECWIVCIHSHAANALITINIPFDHMYSEI